MQQIRNNAGSDSDSEISSSTWGNRSSDQNAIDLLIKQANSAKLLDIFKAYNIDITDGYGGKKCCCPFPDHNDNSPSFYYYGETNSFNCFGCSRGGSAVRFVSIIESISYEEAANKIANHFYIDANIKIENNIDFLERQNIILDFSKSIREFIHVNKEDDIAIKYAEKLTQSYDTLIQKHKKKLENAGLKKVVETLKSKLDRYK